MAESFTVYTLTALEGETVFTNWIDVRDAKRLRLFAEEIWIDPEHTFHANYRASIAQSTLDPAQNTPIVNYGETYMCGSGVDGYAYIPTHAEIFDRVGKEFGANYIKLALTNYNVANTVKLTLLKETIV